MLLKTTEEIRQYCTAIGTSTDFTALVPAIRQAEQEYIIPAMSAAQYAVIESAYQAETIAGKNLQLLQFAQASLCYFVAWFQSTTNGIILTDGGNMEPTPSNTTPARIAMIEASQEQFFQTANVNLDAMLAFMEANKSDFTQWTASEAYTLSKELFINSTAEYESTGLRINKSRAIFMSIRPFISEVEQFTIRPILGKTLFDGLKARILDGTSTTSDKNLIKQISKALAYLSMLEALPTMNVKVTTNGLQISQSNNSVTQKSLAKDNAKSQFYEQIHKTGSANLTRLREFLEENAADYPDYVTVATQMAAGKKFTQGKIIESCDGSVLGL